MIKGMDISTLKEVDFMIKGKKRIYLKFSSLMM